MSSVSSSTPLKKETVIMVQLTRITVSSTLTKTIVVMILTRATMSSIPTRATMSSILTRTIMVTIPTARIITLKNPVRTIISSIPAKTILLAQEKMIKTPLCLLPPMRTSVEEKSLHSRPFPLLPFRGS